MTLTVDIIVSVDEGTMVNEIVENLFVGSDDRGIADVEDFDIKDYNVTDSK